MRSLILLVMGSALAFAQTTKTTVTDTIYDGAGNGVTGQCTYRLASGRALGAVGSQIVGEPVTVRFVAGAFSANIVPTDTASPATQYYIVNCSGSRGWEKSGFWQVPTSSSAVKWFDVWKDLEPTNNCALGGTWGCGGGTWGGN